MTGKPPRPVVMTSLESADGQRCVDLIRHGDKSWAFRECRRDPEDNHGWRPLSAAEPRRYPSETEALAAARESVRWLGTS
ncbi:MAG: hypothetical protein AAGD47_05240 [Pseudomonadota bacterium]